MADSKKTAPTVKETPISFIRRTPLTEKRCKVCGKPFTGTARALYDTPACKQRANYQKHAEQYRAARMEKYRQQKQQMGKEGVRNDTEACPGRE